jgi:LPXTG-motif cell wall-anchored protein
MKKKNIIASIIGALVAVGATIFFINKKKRQPGEEIPPKDAPQLKIENPGEQSEFTASPSWEPDLG